METRDPALPRRCTFTPSDWHVLAGFWHPVCFSTEVTPAKPLGARLLDEELVLYRSGARVVAARDLCLHRGVPLTLGWMDKEEIVCAYHGFRYGAGGQCTAVPAQPGLAIPKSSACRPTGRRKNTGWCGFAWPPRPASRCRTGPNW